MTMTFNGTSGLTFPDASTQATAASGFGFKNRIINGAMVIDQRSAGASTSVQSSTTYASCDRWMSGASQNSKYTVQQNAGSVTPPTGFTNYLGVTSSSAYSIAASDYFYLAQRIEGYNIADLGFGASGASTVTISFWVRSSLTGTFSVSLLNATANRFYPATYTISSANTWEQKTVTIAGDTSGTWNTTNGLGIMVYFSLGLGSDYTRTAGSWGSTGYAATGNTSVVGTNGATFYITGVQLEKGSVATSFDYRPYGTELALCQRYFNRFGAASSDISFGIGFRDATTTISMSLQMPVSVRATPSISFNGTISTLGNGQGLSLSSPTAIVLSANNQIVRYKAATSGSLTGSNTPYIMYSGGISDYVDYNSEL